MSEPKLTPDEYAELMKNTKPHLIKLEEEFSKVDYGTVEVKFEVRGGVVDKMSFFESKTWLKPNKPKEPLT